MEAAGLGLNGLALRAGASQSNLWHAKNNGRLLGEATLEKIARVIGADIADLICLRSKQPLCKSRAASVGRAVSERPVKTIICGHCGKPGKTRSRNNKYPNEKCGIAVKRARAKAESTETCSIHGVSGLNHALAGMTRNKILLGNLEQEGLRTCLNCRKGFKSEGPWNRICPWCKGIQQRREAYGAIEKNFRFTISD